MERRSARLLLAAFSLFLTGLPAGAQIAPGVERPGDVRPELPPLEEPRELPRIELPPAPEESPALVPGLRIEVERLEVTGSTVFDADDFAELTDPYVGRPITTQDLRRLRNELTLLYVDAGYVNSGVVLPDQDPSDGVVEFRIIEGRLAAVELAGLRFSSAGYVRTRLMAAAGTPLHLDSLNDALQLLHLDRRIERVQAELEPGHLPGDAILRVQVEEALPVAARIEAANDISPLVGGYRGQVALAHTSLLGRFDVLSGRVGFTEGLVEYELAYDVPVTRFETLLRLRYRRNESDVVENPFDDLNITNDTQTAAVGLRQPLLHSPSSLLGVFVEGEWRKNRSTSGTPGIDNAETRVSVLRTGADWSYRSRRQVLAARTQLSFGIGALGTGPGGSSAGSGFVSFLGQLQYVYLFPFLAAQVLARFDVQLASTSLPSIEQFSVGGQASVRGYRENKFVRDNGLVGSLEGRLPLWRDPDSELAFVVFSDVGRSWNDEKGFSDRRTRTPLSVGLGLRATLWRHFYAEITWARALDARVEPDDKDLQDHGVHFRVALEY